MQKTLKIEEKQENFIWQLTIVAQINIQIKTQGKITLDIIVKYK
jgi:hypothetical protein